jgi:hypothetical protein
MFAIEFWHENAAGAKLMRVSLLGLPTAFRPGRGVVLLAFFVARFQTQGVVAMEQHLLSRLAYPIVLVVLGLALQAPTAAADDADPKQLLFVQNATGYSFADGKLTLTGISPTTLWFTDRPDRKVGHVPMDRFLALWDEGENSFAKDPPNVALAIAGSDQQPVIAELTHPKLVGDSLTYDAKLLEGTLAPSGGSTAVLIDGGCMYEEGNPNCWGGPL